jgi:hypothetical protein
MGSALFQYGVVGTTRVTKDSRGPPNRGVTSSRSLSARWVRSRDRGMTTGWPRKHPGRAAVSAVAAR